MHAKLTPNTRAKNPSAVANATKKPTKTPPEKSNSEQKLAPKPTTKTACDHTKRVSVTTNHAFCPDMDRILCKSSRTAEQAEKLQISWWTVVWCTGRTGDAGRDTAVCVGWRRQCASGE